MKNIVLRRHARRAARHRHGRSSREMLKEKFSRKPALDGVEPEGHRARLRLRQEALRRARCPSASRRWTRRRTRSSSTATPPPRSAASTPARRSPPGTPSRRRPACSTRSSRFCERVPHRQGRPASGATASCRRRTSSRPSAWSSAPRGTGARVVHVDRGAGHLADERAHRARVLRRDPRRHRRRAARRPVDRDADAHAAGRHPARARTRRTATRSTSCSSRRTRPSASTSPSKAFDLAERFQTPVFMLTDLDIGMNDWVVPRLEWDDTLPPDRGRVLTREELEAMPKFYRYSPEDELGVAARTLPGVHAKGAFFTRGSGHNKLGGYTEIPDEYQEVMDRLAAQAQGRARPRPAAPSSRSAGAAATFGVVTVGGCDLAVREALERARASTGVAATTCASAASPSATRSRRFLDEHDDRLRRRAEPRRAAPLAAHARDGGAEGEAALGARLRRLPAAGRPGRRRASMAPARERRRRE